MSVIGSNVLAGASGGAGGAEFEIERSLRFNSSDSAHLNKNFASAGNRKTWTWSGWVKRSSFGSRQHVFGAVSSGSSFGAFEFNADDELRFYDNTLGDSNAIVFETGRVFRDSSAWYHIVVALDSTAGTDAERIKLYVNGVQEESSSFSTGPTVVSNGEGLTNSNSVGHNIGSWTPASSSLNLNAYLAEIHFVDGQALDQFSFGEFDDNSVWQPKQVSDVTYGNNGFHLDFSDNSSNPALGDDRSKPDYNKLSGALTTTSGSGSFYSGPASRAFDGSTSSDVKGGWLTAGDTSNLIWSPPAGSYSVSSSLRVYAGYYSTISVNGVSKATGGHNTAANWVTLNHTGAITEIKFENATNNNVVRISAIEIDGTVLVSNAWKVNNLEAGTSYSTGNSITSSLALGGAGYILNGLIDYDATMSNSGTGAWIEFNPPGGIAYNNKVEVMANNNPNDNMRLQLNGGSLVNTVASNTYVTLATGSGTINKIRLQGDTSLFRWRSIRVDGVVLQEITAGTDSLIDTPTNYEASSGNNGGNYATFNPLYKRTSTTFSNGNLQLAAAAYYRSGIATISLDNGKWYYEAEILTNSGNNYSMVGVTTAPENETYSGGGSGDDGFGWYSTTGALYPSGGTYSTWTTGDVVSVAYDSATRKTWIAKNGVWQNSGDPAAGTGSVFTIGGTKTPYFSTATGTDGVIVANFGQRPFEYTPPTGFLSLCTQNLDDPLIADGSTAFDVKTWDGDSTERPITGYKFSVDFAWIKTRNGSDEHVLSDIVRGAGKVLSSSAINKESDFADPGHWGSVKTFNSDGFTVQSGAGGYHRVNLTGRTYVGWAWDGGDLATVSAFNQSQVWSSGTSTSLTQGSWANVFANSFSTSWADGTDAWVLNTSSTLNFSTALPTGAIQVYATASGASATDCYVSFSDGTNTYTTGNLSGVNHAWVDVASGSSLSGITSVTINSGPGSSEGLSLKAIKVAGKELVDAGLIPVGGLNSSLYDQSTTWSDLMSGHYQNAASAFDANGTTYAEANSGATIEIDLSNNSITATSRLQVLNDPAFTGSTDVQYKIYTTSSSSPAFSKTIGGTESFNEASSNWSSAAITKITVRGLNEGARISKVIYDGKTLVNDTTTPPNLPSLTSTVRANPTAGFSIVSYTGSTGTGSFAHGLNAAPEFVIIKNREEDQNWTIYHKSLTLGDYLKFTLNSAIDYPMFNDAHPNSSVVYVGNDDQVSKNGIDYIAYCWTPVEGYSSFGKYSGDGSDDGPFVYTGFRPAFIITKAYSTNSNNNNHWNIRDTTRNPYNEAGEVLAASNSNTFLDNSHTGIDILSNGFKLKADSNGQSNYSGWDFIYAAFAENPFKTARAR